MPKIIQLKFEGRFGNNLFQHATARAAAERLGAELQTPPWVGQRIFKDVPENPIWGEADCVWQDDLNFPETASIVSLSGFFQETRFTRTYTRALARQWFALKPEFQITSRFLKVAHLRWGDNVGNPAFTEVTMESYIAAIKEYGYNFDDFIFVSEEKPHCDPKIPHEFEFLVDFQIMQQAAVLFRGNSSFSWWAGCLGDAEVFSPRVNGKVGKCDCRFEKGNHCQFTSLVLAGDVDNPPDL